MSNAELHLLQKLGGCLEPHSNTLFSEVPCVWFSSQQASQRTSPGGGPWQAPELVAEQQPASMPGRFPCRKQGSPVNSLLIVCLPWHPAPQLHLCSPRCQGFQNKGGSVFGASFGYKAVCTCPCHHYDCLDHPPHLFLMAWNVCDSVGVGMLIALS